MPIETKILLSECFPPGVSVIRFGRYKLHAVPVPSETEGEAILSFVNTYKDPMGGDSHPEEANIVCRLFL